MLILGGPRVGKTTALRDISRFLSTTGDLRVMIVESTFEIAGSGEVVLPVVGGARRFHAHNGRDHLKHSLVGYHSALFPLLI